MTAEDHIANHLKFFLRDDYKPGDYVAMDVFHYSQGDSIIRSKDIYGTPPKQSPKELGCDMAVLRIFILKNK